MASAVDTAPEHALAARLRDRVFGSVRVVDASTSIERDSDGDLSVYLNLRLTDPKDAGWSESDLESLQAELLDILEQLQLPMSVYVTLRPTTDEQQEDDEQLPFD